MIRKLKRLELTNSMSAVLSFVYFLLFIFISCSKLGYCSPVSERDWYETKLYHEIFIDENIPIMGAGDKLELNGKKPQSKRNIKAKRNSPEINFYDHADPKTQKIVMRLTNDGLIYQGKVLCQWEKKVYDTMAPRGAGALLKDCPLDLPLQTYRGSIFENETFINLALEYIEIKQDYLVTEFQGQLLYVELSQLKDWKHRLSKSKTESEKITTVMKDSKFSKFLRDLNICFSSKKLECLKPFIQLGHWYRNFNRNNSTKTSDAPFSLWPDKVSPIVCSSGKNVELSGRELGECLQENEKLREDVSRCVQHFNWKNTTVKFIEYDENLKPEVLVKDERYNIHIENSGKYFGCYFSRISGKWYFSKLFPRMQEIRYLREKKLIRIEGPALWPFKELLTYDSGPILYRFYIMADREQVLRDIAKHLREEMSQHRKIE